MNELKLGDVVTIGGKRFEVDQLKQATMADGEMVAFFTPVQEKEPESDWVECEVYKHAEWGEQWYFNDPKDDAPYELSDAVNIPGFGGVLYEGCSVWGDVPAYITAPGDKRPKPLNPVKVRFWREAL